MLGRHNPGTVDLPTGMALGWNNTMAVGPQTAYSRKIVWARDCEPTAIDAASIYVFDASQDDAALSKVNSWMAIFEDRRPPLVVVIAPKPNDAMTMAEHDAFDAAMDPLWAYPLSRPSEGRDLLAYVSSVLTLTFPQPAPPNGVPELLPASVGEKPVLRYLEPSNRID